MNENIIVGVDPGTTSAVAAIDLRGRIVGLHSSKDMGVSQTLKYVLSCGRPSLVATDVNPAPDFVSTIASRFGVTLFVPERTLAVAEKLDMTRGFEAQDAHQRDALAAAVYAYLAFKNKFQKMDSLGLSDEVKHLVLQGLSISSAKAEVEKRAEKPSDEPKCEEETPKKQISPQESRIRDLERRIKALQDVIDDREKALTKLSEELAHARRVRHMKAESKHAAEKRIHSLQVKLNQLSGLESLLRGVLSGELLLVGTYPQVAGGLSLVEVMPAGVGGIVYAFTSTNKVRQHLIDKGIRVYSPRELSSVGEYHFIPKNRLNRLSSTHDQKPNIEEIISEYRRKRP